MLAGPALGPPAEAVGWGFSLKAWEVGGLPDTSPFERSGALPGFAFSRSSPADSTVASLALEILQAVGH